MIQKYRFNFTGDDKIAFANMIFVCQRDLPVKAFVGYDDEETPYIFAGFVGRRKWRGLRFLAIFNDRSCIQRIFGASNFFVQA